MTERRRTPKKIFQLNLEEHGQDTIVKLMGSLPPGSRKTFLFIVAAALLLISTIIDPKDWQTLMGLLHQVILG